MPGRQAPCVAISAWRFLRRFALFSAAAWAAGCAVGPDYHRPTADVPPAWQPEAPWHEAAPSDATLKGQWRSEEHTSELQSLRHLVCRLLLEKKKKKRPRHAKTTVPDVRGAHMAS